MNKRHIYLKIEPLNNYSPVAPDDAEHHKYRIDCMRNMDHEDGNIPAAEIERRRLQALVYREYLDANYTILKTDPLIAADVNEPPADRRIPGTVIYAKPGERLYIHVFNADLETHSLHMHGLHYGIDSDGSWPFGVHRDDGNRSDAICPDEEWCYVFDVKQDTIGAWPFHDHHMHITEVVDRGLFGGLVVRDPDAEKPDLEVPLFLHRLAGETDAALFDSGTLNPGDTFTFTFPDEGTFDYYCKFHPMQGRVRVTTTGPATATVNILDTPARFELDDVTIRAGGTVTWTHAGNQPHTVTDRTGAGLESYCLNGRTFVGNTPTIVAESGKRIRWYVFNLDLGMMWHNFHLHGQRWKASGEWVDTRSMGPAESFVVDTVVPPVILLPLPLDCGCEPQEGHEEPPPLPHEEHPAMESEDNHDHDNDDDHDDDHDHDEDNGHTEDNDDVEDDNHDDDHDDDDDDDDEQGERRKYKLQGDFLIHCHVEMHMMQGMAALVRAIQEVRLTKRQVHKICFHMPKVRLEECPDVDHHPCRAEGNDNWELLGHSSVFVVHGALLSNGRVLVFSGAAEGAHYPLEARTWDPATKAMTAPVIPLPEDFFCSGHTFLPDGRLLVVGGDTNGAGHTNNRCYFFTPDPVNPDTGTFTATASMARARWYPTTLRLSDGRVLAFSGWSPLAQEVEVFDGTGAWNTISGANRAFEELYPGMHLLPSGEIFYSRTGWAAALGTQTAYLSITGPATGSWTDYGQQQFYDRQEGMSLLMIDTTVSPVRTRLFVFGGGVSGAPTALNNQSAEMIEFNGGIAGASWQRLKDMNFARTNVNAVVLPNGKILIAGGHSNGQKWSPTAVLPTEIYDPETDTYTTTAMLNAPRQYHSVCILLPDGRVFAAGGVAPEPGAPERDQHTMELYTPGYLTGDPQPVITNVPGTLAFGSSFTIDTPEAADIGSIVLLAPISVTHHTDSGQRYIRLPIQSRTASTLDSLAPANGNIAPPGFYMIFIVTNDGIPSAGRFVQIA